MNLESIYKRMFNSMSDFFLVFVSLFRVVFKSKFNITLPKAISESCIILGNGPSLSESLVKNEDFIKKHTLICVNAFSLSDDFVKLKPSYYVFLDPGWWKNTSELRIQNTFKLIEENTTWSLDILIPFNAYDNPFLKEMPKNNSNINLHYFNYTVFSGFKSISYWFYKKNLGMPQSQNVIVASIFLSLNIGFKEVYLLGIDHTWHNSIVVNNDNVVCIKDEHFYSDKKVTSYRPFKKVGHLNDVFSMHEVFFTLSKVFYGYESLSAYAEYKKAKIYNATPDSFVDAFERFNIKEE